MYSSLHTRNQSETSNMGHSRTGKVSIHYSELLPKCSQSDPGVWYLITTIFWFLASMVSWHGSICWSWRWVWFDLTFQLIDFLSKEMDPKESSKYSLGTNVIKIEKYLNTSLNSSLNRTTSTSSWKPRLFKLKMSKGCSMKSLKHLLNEVLRIKTLHQTLQPIDGWKKNLQLHSIAAPACPVNSLDQFFSILSLFTWKSVGFDILHEILYETISYTKIIPVKKWQSQKWKKPTEVRNGRNRRKQEFEKWK